MNDYRYNAFNDVLESVAITGETHIIPSNSPYTIRLCEVPDKTDPTSISLTIAGVAASEVAAEPAAGEFWPDYSTSADSDTSWNTGLIQFNAADAGKTVVANYNGMGSLVSVDYRGSQLFTESGTFTAPKGVTKVRITGCGGGGGSTGGAYDDPNYFYGASGAGGAACIKTAITVVPGQSYAITVGAGGSAGTKLTSGGAGGTTSFGALLSLAGGGGGSYSSTGGGAGGSAGGAGGSAGLEKNTLFGYGGSCIFGSHTVYRGRGAGVAGSNYGSGGAGGYYNQAGAAGSQGFILVEW